MHVGGWHTKTAPMHKFQIGRSGAEYSQVTAQLYTDIAHTGHMSLLAAPFQSSSAYTDILKPQDMLRYMFDQLMVSARNVRRQAQGLPAESIIQGAHCCSMEAIRQ